MTGLRLPFSIDLPPQWTLSTVILAGPIDEEQPDSGMLRTSGMKAFQRNMVATMEQVPAGETPEKYVDRQMEGLRKAGVDHWRAESETVMLQGGQSGLITEQVVVGADGEQVRQMQLVAIKNGIAHTLILSHLDGEPFESARVEFRQILLSFA